MYLGFILMGLALFLLLLNNMARGVDTPEAQSDTRRMATMLLVIGAVAQVVLWCTGVWTP